MAASAGPWGTATSKEVLRPPPKNWRMERERIVHRAHRSILAVFAKGGRHCILSYTFKKTKAVVIKWRRLMKILSCLSSQMEAPQFNLVYNPN